MSGPSTTKPAQASRPRLLKGFARSIRKQLARLYRYLIAKPACIARPLARTALQHLTGLATHALEKGGLLCTVITTGVAQTMALIPLSAVQLGMIVQGVLGGVTFLMFDTVVMLAEVALRLLWAQGAVWTRRQEPTSPDHSLRHTIQAYGRLLVPNAVEAGLAAALAIPLAGVAGTALSLTALAVPQLVLNALVACAAYGTCRGAIALISSIFATKGSWMMLSHATASQIPPGGVICVPLAEMQCMLP